jgi:ATP/maltotriose-dependent transcriptional regulator MalT
LRFTLDEANRFLFKIKDLPLSRSRSEELETRTEGWEPGCIGGASLAG